MTQASKGVPDMGTKHLKLQCTRALRSERCREEVWDTDKADSGRHLAHALHDQCPQQGPTLCISARETNLGIRVRPRPLLHPESGSAPGTEAGHCAAEASGKRQSPEPHV